MREGEGGIGGEREKRLRIDVREMRKKRREEKEKKREK